MACNWKQSPYQNITTGVPQGSALGPLLFIIFINDFPQHIKSSASNLFADDCCIYKTGELSEITKSSFHNSVAEAHDWYTNNNLPLNISKTMCMLAGYESLTKRLEDGDQSLNISINGEAISQKRQLPYLGIIMDCSLKWNDQIMKLCKGVSSKLALLGRLRKFLNKTTLRHIYLTIIQPQMDYAISVWGYCSQTNRDLVTRLQHRAARIVCGNMDYVNVRGDDLVNELGWQTLEKRRDYFTATLMYKIINENAPKRLIDSVTFIKDTHEIPTRSASTGLLQVPQPNYEIFRNSLKYQGALVWNNLPAQLKNTPDIVSFKRLYKHLYFHKRHAVAE